MNKLELCCKVKELESQQKIINNRMMGFSALIIGSVYVVGAAVTRNQGDIFSPTIFFLGAAVMMFYAWRNKK